MDIELYDSGGNQRGAAGNITKGLNVVVAPHTKLLFSAYGEVSINHGGSGFLSKAVTTVYFGGEYWTQGMQQGVGLTDSGVCGESFSISYVNNTNTEHYV